MRRTAIAVCLTILAAGSAEAKGPPTIRVSLPADFHAAGARGAFLLLHTFHHATPMPLATIGGTAEGIVNGVRRSVPLRIVPDTTAQGGEYLLIQTWPKDGVWVLNITGRLDAEADLVIGIGRSGVPTYMERPRTAIGWSRQATASEVDQLLRYLDGQRATAPDMTASRLRAVLNLLGA